MELIDREWKEFYIGELFKVKRPSARSETKYNSGEYPFVASGNFNNGVIRCCSKKECEKLDRGNCITVSPVDGSAFYQISDFLGRGGAGSSVLLLYNEKINRYSGLYISKALRQTCLKYSYGKMGNQDGIKREKIMLPVDEFGNPDYLFMEEYVREEEKRKNEKYIAYAEKQLKTLQYIEIPMLDEKKWKEFFIGGELGVFKIKSTSSGIDKNKLNNTKGKIPYITRTDKSNGIDLFVSDIQNEKYAIDAGNIISVGLDTQTVFYQPHTFYTGQNIQVVSNSNLNEYNAQFICKLLEIQLRKFNWGGNGATLGRLARTKIMLPIDDFGTPDYPYMEQYTKNLIVVKLKKYLAFAKK